LLMSIASYFKKLNPKLSLDMRSFLLTLNEYKYYLDSYIQELQYKILNSFGINIYTIRNLIEISNKDLVKNENENYIEYLSEKKEQPQTISHSLDLVNIIYPLSNYTVREPEFVSSFSPYDLPLILNKNLLLYILQQDKSISLEQGDLCFDIQQKKFTNEDIEFDFQRNRLNKKKEGIELISNIDLEESKYFYKITDINYKDFPKGGFFSTKTSKTCYPQNFKKKDDVIGFFKDGIYESLYKDLIERLFDQERKIFMKNFNGYETKKMSFFDSIKKKFRYPRSVQNLLVLRKKPISILKNIEEEKLEVKAFTEGFYNTLIMRKNILAGSLRKELYKFILKNYKKKIVSYNDKEILEKLVKDQTFFLSKNNVKKLVLNLTEEKDYLIGLEKLLNTPKINSQDYPILQSIAFFVLCEENQSCDLLSYSTSNTLELDIFNKKVNFYINKEYYDF
jgi:hypothetical protein